MNINTPIESGREPKSIVAEKAQEIALNNCAVFMVAAVIVLVKPFINIWLEFKCRIWLGLIGQINNLTCHN